MLFTFVLKVKTWYINRCIEVKDMTESTIISNLLKKLSEDHPDISSKLRCCYSDGMGETIYEITVHQQPGNRYKGNITFQLESGKVLLCKYKGLKISHSEDVVDTLLDLINYENK